MKVVTFGEIMLRLSPPGHLRVLQAENYDASYGGGEVNVAVSLANYGLQSEFVTKLPKHEVGQAAINSLNKYGVGTKFVARGGKRVGIYYMEKGASQRASKVIYDRADSAFAKSDMSDYDWDKIFNSANWLHITGITPALGENIAKICLYAVREARRRSITVSCDINYRNKLWTREEARKVMSEICKNVDVYIANEEDSEAVFNISAVGQDAKKGKPASESYIEVAERLKKKFGFKIVALTLNESISASENNWSAMLHIGDRAYFSRKYPIHVVNSVGGGDAFGAGLIYGMLSGWTEQKIVEFASAASCLKHTVEGDFNIVEKNEVLSLVDGNASGRVQR